MQQAGGRALLSQKEEPYQVRLPAFIIVTLLALLGVSSAEDAEWLPGPASNRRAPHVSGAVINHECEVCHVAIAAEWRASQHRQSNSNPAFVRSLRKQPLPFCRRCHAPEADPQKEASGWAAENGITCITCHLLGEKISSGISNQATNPPAQGLTHPIVRDARLSGDGACERCHEFQFPDGKWRRRPEFMQLTMREHAESAHAKTSCIECHMRRAPDGHRSHLFLGGHDEATLRAALRIEANLQGNALELVLTPQRVGHALPTGDLFRRLLVRIEDLNADGGLIAQKDLTRRFSVEQQVPGATVRITASDDRLYGPKALLFPLAANIEGVRWSVRYQRVLFPQGASNSRAVIDSEVILGQGIKKRILQKQ